jgi:hypothetical protein
MQQIHFDELRMGRIILKLGTDWTEVAIEGIIS